MKARQFVTVFATYCIVSYSAADTGNLTIGADVTGTCKFIATPDAMFGDLDPSSGANATASISVQFWCTKNSAFTLAAGNGANYDTAISKRGLKGIVSSDYIPYTLSPITTVGAGKGESSPITITASGTVLGADYTNAPSGSYSDVIQFSINP